MRIFENEKSSWDSKVNFVDDNDVYVGYDTSQCCCEHAGYFISDKIEHYNYEADYDQKVTPDVSDYFFDKDFFEDVESPDLDCGGMVAFKLKAEGKPDLYLHLFNSHNGYYGHGFVVKHSGEEVKSGGL